MHRQPNPTSVAKQLKTKKAATDAGMLTSKRWFAKFFVPRLGEQPTNVKGTAFFAEHQVEEVFSISKGMREIGPLRPGSQPVGKKKFRSVTYAVYRESDFLFQPKTTIRRKLEPPRTVDLLEAIAKIQSTATKFKKASESAKNRKDHKRSRGFKKRMNNLLELAELGIRRAINEQRIKLGKTIGKSHHYFGEGREFPSKVSPPKWLVKESPAINVAGLVKPSKEPRCRLMDAVHTIDRLRGDPTLDW